MIQIFKKNNQMNRGFTLIETLVGISIFTVSVLGLLSILTQSIANTDYAKDKIVASYLAQEGIEYVRNMRDTYVLYDATSPQNGWNSFNTKLSAASCQNPTGCYLDDKNVSFSDPDMPMTNLLFTSCASGTCPALLYDSTTGKYGYVSGINSHFIRKIQINQVSADDTKILSTVFWTQGTGQHSVTFSEDLFNWVQ